MRPPPRSCWIDEIAPDAVIFSGIAGNLNTHLHINDVVLGGTLRFHLRH